MLRLVQIEYEALHLPEEERAKLAQKLLLGLDVPTVEQIEQKLVG